MKYNNGPSEVLAQQLRDYFPQNPDAVEDLLAEPQHAPIAGTSGQTVPYLRVNEGASRPVFFAPGFGESYVNKLSTAAAFASEGFDVILPGQNRSRINTGRGVNTATATQARNNRAVLRHAGVETGPHIVAHSFGALVVPETVMLLEQDGVDMSKSAVALLAPAGVGLETSYANIGKRWVQFLKSEWGPKDKAFPDTTGETGQASMRALLAGPRQTVAEMQSLRHGHVNFDYLCKRVARVAIVPYAEDAMYPEAHVGGGLSRLLGYGGPENLHAFTPVSFGPDENGILRRELGAVHDDEQFNPHRVVPPVAAFLRAT